MPRLGEAKRGTEILQVERVAVTSYRSRDGTLADLAPIERRNPWCARRATPCARICRAARALAIRSVNGSPSRHPKDHQPAAPDNSSPTTHNDGGREIKTFGFIILSAFGQRKNPRNAGLFTLTLTSLGKTPDQRGQSAGGPRALLVRGKRPALVSLSRSAGRVCIG